MAILKTTYESEEEIPEGYSALYADLNGKFELTEVDGMKTEADISRMRIGLEKERKSSKDLRARIKAYDGLPEDWQEQIDSIPELKAQAGNVDEAKLSELVDAKVARETAPLKRTIEGLTGERDEARTSNEGFKTKDRTRAIRDALDPILREAKIRDSAYEDAYALAAVHLVAEETDGRYEITTRDQVGITPGLGVAAWLDEVQPKRTHWWPDSGGGGAGGGDGRSPGGYAKNPWTSEHWSLTEQMVAERADPGRAKQMATSAGVTVNASRPKAAS